MPTGKPDMKKVSKLTILKTASIVCGLVAGLSAFVHPAGQVRVTGNGVTGEASQPLLSGGDATPAVLAIVERSCQNCHSENTHWPWYGYIAPMSWIMENDVSAARRHMNLTSWQTYTSDEKNEILSEIAPLVRNRIMPPQRYLALHPEAKLSAVDIDRLVAWTHEERRTIRGVSRR